MKISILSLYFISINLFAAHSSFKQISGKIDPHCPTWSEERFYDDIEYIYFSTRGGEDAGFTYEFPISREGIDYIWCLVRPELGRTRSICPSYLYANPLRPFEKFAAKKPYHSRLNLHYENREQQMDDYFRYVSKELIDDEIKYPNIGKVLEILARMYLQEMTDLYPKSIYKITSGVEYKKVGHPVLGELDIIVYDKSSCKVKVLGESKASSRGSLYKALRKAKEQIRRFQTFLWTL
jgi:hypothetical protein